jgi:hypothetical protein
VIRKILLNSSSTCKRTKIMTMPLATVCHLSPYIFKPTSHQFSNMVSTITPTKSQNRRFDNAQAQSKYILRAPAIVRRFHLALTAISIQTLSAIIRSAIIRTACSAAASEVDHQDLPLPNPEVDLPVDYCAKAYLPLLRHSPLLPHPAGSVAVARSGRWSRRHLRDRGR